MYETIFLMDAVIGFFPRVYIPGAAGLITFLHVGDADSDIRRSIATAAGGYTCISKINKSMHLAFLKVTMCKVFIVINWGESHTAR